MIENKKITAIVLAGGSGKRMKAQVSKQYIELKGKPILYYTLKAFEDSIADEIILVTEQGDEEYCRKQIVEKYGLHKISKIVPGGRERYHSVYCGLCAIAATVIVMIHDGARPFVEEKDIEKIAGQTILDEACVLAVRTKDTIKIADWDNWVVKTPDRKSLWQVQTPQCFQFWKIFDAYRYIIEKDENNITDDAMVWEAYFSQPVRLVEGNYYNIKITTPEDLIFAEAILDNRSKDK